MVLISISLMTHYSKHFSCSLSCVQLCLIFCKVSVPVFVLFFFYWVVCLLSYKALHFHIRRLSPINTYVLQIHSFPKSGILNEV